MTNSYFPTRKRSLPVVTAQRVFLILGLNKDSLDWESKFNINEMFSIYFGFLNVFGTSLILSIYVLCPPRDIYGLNTGQLKFMKKMK